MIRIQTTAAWKSYPTPGIKSSKPGVFHEQDTPDRIDFFDLVRCGS